MGSMVQIYASGSAPLWSSILWVFSYLVGAAGLVWLGRRLDRRPLVWFAVVPAGIFFFHGGPGFSAAALSSVMPFGWALGALLAMGMLVATIACAARHPKGRRAARAVYVTTTLLVLCGGGLAALAHRAESQAQETFATVDAADPDPCGRLRRDACAISAEGCARVEEMIASLSLGHDHLDGTARMQCRQMRPLFLLESLQRETLRKQGQRGDGAPGTE